MKTKDDKPVTQVDNVGEVKEDKKENAENQNIKNRIKIGSILGVILIATYLSLFLRWVYGSGQGIDTEIIHIGSIEQSYNMDAYIVRNEEVLKSPFDGKYIPEIAEGERVAANCQLATIMKESSDALLRNMKDIDLKILKAKKEKNGNRELFSADLSKIDDDIEQNVTLLASLSDSNDIAQLSEIRGNINELIKKKSSIVGGLGNNEFLRSLESEKQSLQNMINQNTKKICTSSAGIICYSVDGYEEALNFSSLRNLTPKYLSQINNAKSAQNNGESIAFSGKPFAKIIKDTEFYVVIVLDPVKANLFKIDDTVRIRFNDIGKTINGTVDYKSDNQDDKYILAVKVDMGISETAKYRKLNVDVIKSSFTGLKVPLSCLKNFDKESMKAKIILNRANYASEREVKVIGKNDEWAIIESAKKSADEDVSLYDIYITKPENIVEGQLISK